MGPWLSESFLGSESLQPQRGNDQQHADNATPELVLTGNQLAEECLCKTYPPHPETPADFTKKGLNCSTSELIF